MGAPGLSAPDLEQRTVEIGRELLAQLGHAHGGWADELMDRLMGEEAIRVQALRFVDVLPMLEENAELARHLREYLSGSDLNLPGLINLGVRAATGAHGSWLAPAVRITVTHMARRFIGGADLEEALRTARKLREHGRAVSLDLLGETTVSEAEATGYQKTYQQILIDAQQQMRRWPQASAQLDMPHLHVSLKVSSLYSQIHPADFDGSVAAIAERVRPIFTSARNSGSAICLDMEHYDYRDIIVSCFRMLLSEPSLQNWSDGGVAMQAYLADTESVLAELIDWARGRAAPITVRLVRGAYWDYETIVAAANSWPSPVWSRKEETDACYERCLDMLFHAHPHVRVAVATHNVRSVAYALALAERTGRRPGEFEFQMLYGMAPQLEQALIERGHRVRVYLPFGELLPGMAYLVRRLLENASSQSFRRLRQHPPAPPAVLLASPHLAPTAPDPQPIDGPATAARFTNTPAYRFTEEKEREAVRAGLATVRAELGRSYPLILDGDAVTSDSQLASLNPARPWEEIGRVAQADVEHVDRAVAAAARALPAWAALGMDARADLLERAAAELRARRNEFAAWEILEAGKNWAEADANVTEAIDYLNYYAQEARRLGAGRRMDVPGETNVLEYRPRGVGVIVPPWNFPLAILTGMLSAAIVTGNTAILKPSSQTPVIAARLVELLRDVRLPPGVVQFLPGSGSRIGDPLVRHPGIHFVAFTGSLEVGSRIIRQAAEFAPGQHHVKHVIAEMGGKNAIIVDSDADLDDAVRGVVHSAFGYQGQKCSACSRVIVVGTHYERFLKRVVEATASLRMGDPQDPAHYLGPVIEEAARDRINAFIANAKTYATLKYQMDASRLREGWYVGPAIFADVPPQSPLAQEEIFGPVLAVMRARHLDEALQIANGTPYALTGGLYSRSPANVERVKDAFRCGNLYINRKITGALVGRQPFGGFKLSGVGSKAGGPDYLLHFVLPRTVTENTLRHGFAPTTGN